MLNAQEAELLKETHDSTIRTEERMETVEGLVKSHDRVLHGNAHWGLVSRVRVLWFVVITVGLAVGGVILKVALAG